MRHWKRKLDAACSVVLSLGLAGLFPFPASAQTEALPETELRGIILGRVYEIDKAKYQDYVARMEKLKKEGKRDLLDPDEYLVDLPDVAVIARQLSTNSRFSSEFTNGDGAYMIKESPVGAFDFTLLHDQIEYPVSQRLDLNVQLSYIAELCFVVDRQEKKAWMISEGLRRDSDAPPFVPERCQSALSACLAMLTGSPDGFPEGLLLLLAGSGAAAATIGIISTDQREASPPRRR
ncbi:MAG: hypothetical protein ACRD21_27895 [Vicinamibacteria bacterium]